MNPMTPKRTRRLRARAATMNPSEEYEDYGPEPNMKLSHAFLVVLLLHVIAVGGLYAFNSMKAGKAPAIKTAKTAPSNPPGPVKESPHNEEPSPGGGSGEKPPAGGKAPLVAKVAEAPKTAKPTAPANAKSAQPVQAEGNGKGLLASAKGTLQKAAGIGVAATGASKAAAQTTTEPSTAVSATDAAPASAASAAGAKTYIVRAGDTMTRIASSLGVAIPDLERVNSLGSNAVLQVGQVLKVPEKLVTHAASSVASGAGKVAESAGKLPGAVATAVTGRQNEAAAAPVATDAATAPVAGGATTDYTVVKGDNPWKIAKKFKISQEELMKANGITDPKKIQIGQVLKIPASATKAAK
ncbi:MAG: LysM peptidoglycan-binding domain-containing protein [Chthoniobacterales bacterium]